MAITKKLIHFKNFSNFNTQKLSADKDNTTYTVGVGGSVVSGEPYILYHSIVFIKDVLKIWTHGSLYDCGAPELSDYLTESEAAELYATKSSLATVATSGSYNDLSNKPTIPSAVTESTVSAWGFTKNTGTYSKPSTGIPKTDLASVVQTSLGKADTALQSYTETDPVFSASAAASIKASDITNWNSKTSNTGTVTAVKMNGTTKNPSSGVVDLGTVITAHQDISGKLDKTTAASTYATIATVNSKQDKVLKFENLTASNWVADSTYPDYGYRCDIATAGVTADMYPEVVFGITEATSGDYAPVARTGAGIVSIWGKTNVSITIPTILITQ